MGARLQQTNKMEVVFLTRAADKAESAKRFGAQLKAGGVERYPLFVSDGLVAAVTHAHLELEAHQGDGGTFGRTFATHCLPTLPAVVLRDTVARSQPQRRSTVINQVISGPSQFFWGFFFCRKLRSTCLKPIFLLSHICLKFQKKGCSHFWQESLSSHSGV